MEEDDDVFLGGGGVNACLSIDAKNLSVFVCSYSSELFVVFGWRKNDRKTQMSPPSAPHQSNSRIRTCLIFLWKIYGEEVLISFFINMLNKMKE